MKIGVIIFFCLSLSMIISTAGAVTQIQAPSGGMSSGEADLFTIDVAGLSNTAGIDILLSFDKTLLSIESIEANASVPDSDLTTNINPDEGWVKILVINSNGINVEGFTPLVDITFCANGPAGTASLQIIDANITTPPNFYPNTFDEKLDGVITITEIVVPPKQPTATFTASPVSGELPLTVIFTDESANNPTSWSWSLGDEATSTDQNPVHTYQKAGTYTVSLTVVNDGGFDSITKSNFIVVSDPMPTEPTPLVAAFSALPVSGDAPLSVKFTDESHGGPVSWKWDFGDEILSTEQNPEHIYQKAGIYSVTLEVTNSDGSDVITETDLIVVNANKILEPIAAFSFNPAAPKVGTKIRFIDESFDLDGLITSFHWSFGDGKSSVDQNPVHTYFTEGIYEVILLTIDDEGNENSISHKINVKEKNPGKAKK